MSCKSNKRNQAHSNEALPSWRAAPSFTEEGTKAHMGHDLFKEVKTWTRIHTSRFMVEYSSPKTMEVLPQNVPLGSG